MSGSLVYFSSLLPWFSDIFNALTLIMYLFFLCVCVLNCGGNVSLMWLQFSSVQCLNHIQLFATPGTTARQASKSITISWSLPKLMSIESVMPSNHLILCRPLQSCPQSFPASGYFQMSQLFTSGGQKYWSFSFNISPSSKHPGQISFRMDCLDLLALQGTLKESSPTPQLKSINSWALSFLYSPTLTSIHDYWKNHSFE